MVDTPDPQATSPDLAADLQKLRGRRFRTTVAARDDTVRNHVVHGTPVLPGVFLLDLVLRLARQVGVDPGTVVLRRCLFHTPVVAVGSHDRQLLVEVGELSAERQTLPVTVRGRAVEDGVADDGWQIHFQAELHPQSTTRAVPPSLGAVEPVNAAGLITAATDEVDAEVLYRLARRLDIHHRDFMKAEGRLYTGPGFSLADARLSPAAAAYLDRFHVHPVILDFATLVLLAQLDCREDGGTAKPFIPIYINSFQAPRRFVGASLVYVPHAERQDLDAETLAADIWVCEPNGAVVAAFEGFRAKRVRSAEHITRLAVSADRVSAPAPRPAADGAGRPLEAVIADLVGAALNEPAAAVEPDRGFYDLGLTSTDLLGIAAKLEREVGGELYPTLLFEFPTVRSLAAHLRGQGLECLAPPATIPGPGVRDTDIAIVGLAGRYPGARDVWEFWDVLREGRDHVTEIPPDRWDHSRFYDPRRNRAGTCYSRWGAFLEGVDEFDPLLFNISPRQAELMDPHERLFLQTVWETVEDAGYAPDGLGGILDGAVGMFAGAMWSDYQLFGLEEVNNGNPEIAGSWLSSLANRASYIFDFQGPSITVDTACSSSLVAVHLACESIRRGECRAAVAGGVNLSLHPYKYLRLAELGFLSTDGRSRIFGKDADGYVPGEGVGAVLLRPLGDALASGDHVYALIKGSALHHSGRTSGYAVPSPEAQGRVVLDALERSGVPAETITYVEAHGTGTTLGDQIEIAALSKALGSQTAKRGFCAIGSVKSNIGHLEGAAGIAALTKVLLCLRSGAIVPTLHTDELNPGIPFSDTPFYVARVGEPWSRPADPSTGEQTARRAAISAFGAGGTNVHLIVEEYGEDRLAARPPRDRNPDTGVVVPLSARDDGRLRDLARRMVGFLRDHDDLSLDDVAYTLQVGRKAMASRLAVVVRDVGDLAEALDEYVAGRPARVPFWTGQVRQASPDGIGTGERSTPLAPEEFAAAWVRDDGVRWETRDQDTRRVSLPTYPFARQRYWISRKERPAAARSAPVQPARAQERLVGDGRTLFYQPFWEARSSERTESDHDGVLVVLDADHDRVVELRQRARRVIWVRPGPDFTRLSPDDYVLNPEQKPHYEALFEALRAERVEPAAILHLWQLSSTVEHDLEGVTGLFSILFLCQSLAVGRRTTLAVVYAFHDRWECPAHAAVGGLARSMRLEQPKLALKTVHFTFWPASPRDACDILLAEAGESEDIEVRHTPDGRAVLGFARSRPTPGSGPLLARDGGVYLVSGGAGGLGLHVARHMAVKARVGLVLFGRSAPGLAQNSAVDELEALGARALYLQADVADMADVERVVACAESRLGPLTGVIHSAGILDDALLINKTPESFRSVLAPKLDGVRNLDQATRAADLDYLILFSSAASVMGSVGSTDYSAANRYLDSFAAWREERRNRGERRGRTLSINWPVWRDGGMGIDPAVAAEVLERAGMEMLDTDEGLAALDAALARGVAQLVVLRGDQARLEQRMTLVSEVLREPTVARVKASPPIGTSTSSLERDLVGIFAEILKVSEDELDVADDLADYGVDSVALMRALERIEQLYRTAVAPSVVTRQASIRALAGYLATELAGSAGGPNSGATGRVAVVAIACRFPGAPRVEDFWENLVEGRDAVCEAPEGRWSPKWLEQVDDEVVAAARWGGFIEGVDQFDAAFFDMPEEEAAWMDPQQRLCLELSQELLERAGYPRAEMAGGRVGVFFGVAPSDHAKRGYLAGAPATAQLLVSALPNMAAARVSHAFDLRGPASTLDTACSSALVALHRACQSVLAGECVAAIAGGCELLLDPFIYVGLAQAGMLSRDGRTRVFDREAAGFVPGEGLGLVLLKEEGQARRDGDQILATIRGSAANNDGRTAGLTAPSHEAQVEVIRAALRAADVSADTVGYLEVNGSASAFGDPIEVHAAAEAYRHDTGRRQFCGIGSVKPNLGALLHAGGVASFTKVVLALQHGYLPPTIHCREPHPRLRFETTPFFPVTEGRSWERPMGSLRRAAVSSFGLGGTNCHVVVEEAPPEYRPRRRPLPFTVFDHKRMSLEAAQVPATASGTDALLTRMTDYLAGHVGELLGVSAGGDAGSIRASIQEHNFMELGLSSAAIVSLNGQIEADLGITLIPTAFFRHPNVGDLAEHLVQEHREPLLRWFGRRGPWTGASKTVPASTRPKIVTGPEPGGVGGGEDIAIIGMSGIFPGSADIAGFWDSLAAGRDLVTEVPARWDHRLFYDPDGRPMTTDCRFGSFIDDVDCFDASFFDVLPSEAEGMDPQLRLLLQVLYSTAEDAGAAASLRGSGTGVFVGQCFQDYDNEMIARGWPPTFDPTGVAVSMTANRPSYFFDLSGPSLTVDTACSSSLYALQLALSALRQGECEMAFAAGTNLVVSPQHYLRLSAIGALSRTGRCYAFDTRADGYVPGEAVAAVLLKPLRRAVADGDPIHALVKSVAVNHGGRASSITAPNPVRQAEVLVRAWDEAGIDPETLTYLEAHGTGTTLGDPIEVDGAKAAFARYTRRERFCALGSAKAHLGHTEGAAGITSVIKTVLSMRHALIPVMPTLREPNPYCRLDEGPLYVNREPLPWHPPSGTPRRAGVSSFGFGGAYAHAVLEERPGGEAAQRDLTRPLVFPFSARNAERLGELVRRHRDYLASDRCPPLDEVATTLQVGREAMAERVAFVVGDRDALLRRLDAYLSNTPSAGSVCGSEAAPDELTELARRWAGGEAVDWSRGFATRPAVRVSLPTYPFAKERHWIDGAASAEGPVEAAAQALTARVAASDYDGARVAAGLDRFDALCRCFLADVLRRWLGEERPITETALRERLADVGKYDRFVRAIGSALGRIEPVADAGPRGSEERKRIQEELRALIVDHPELTAYAELVSAFLPSLPAVLEGSMDALDLYFSPDRPDLLPRLYRGNTIADHHNDLVARAVDGYRRERRRRQRGERLQILEVGAGTGGTTHQVLKMLAGGPADVKYVFTDVSAAFLRAAEQELSASEIDLHFDVLDLDEDPETQGFEPGAFHVIIAANVVHAARRIPAALTRLRRLLVEDGMLVLNEVTSNRDHLTAMIGMIPGWWTYEDAARLPDSPLLDVQSWRQTLSRCGFDGVWPVSSAGRSERDFDHAVILCRAAVKGSSRGDVVDALRRYLRQTFADFFQIPIAAVDASSTYDRYGLDSLRSIQLARTLERDFGKLPKVLLYECTTIDALADYLFAKDPVTCAALTRSADRPPVEEPPPAEPPAPVTGAAGPAPGPAAPCADPCPVADPVAIVGMAGTFPGSPDLAVLWRNLQAGVDLVTEIPAERFDWRSIYGDPQRELGKVNSRWGAFMDGVDRFDAPFFGISPLEAELMDPQQRLFLQTAWQAVEDSGHAPSSLRGTRVGVFVGVTSRDYGWHLLRAGRNREGHVVSGNGYCVIANRVSYQLDLRGPSEAVDTACSSSLTALHRAVCAIHAGECHAALVGGVHAFLTEDLFVALGQLGMLSPDGRCMAFDKRANGFVRGEGVVALYLKPLSRALTDGDTVHALVRGSGVSHGGHVRSLTVPNPNAQADLIATVYRRAGVDPRTVTYVEAHGTGTAIGDPIEVHGLKKAFAELTGRPASEPVAAWCGLGTIKSNMGHLEAAAGLAGVVKTVLAMRRGVVPPSINFEQANPLLEIEGSPFYVVNRLQPWERTRDLAGRLIARRAGVSSLGFGGTNVHVILEEYPVQQPGAATPSGPQVVVLSARTEERLHAYARRLLDHLDAGAADGEPPIPLQDIAHTLRVGRDPMAHRLAVVATDQDDLCAALRDYVGGFKDAPRVFSGRGDAEHSLQDRQPPGPPSEPGDLAAWARLWAAGGDVPWERLRAEGPTPRRVSLPTYPFTPERHWADIEPEQDAPPTWSELLSSLRRGEKSLDEIDRLLVLNNEDGS